MCLIIHKPAGATVPEWLIESALMYNPDGFGIMSGAGVTRKVWATADEAMSTLDSLRAVEAAVHFRYRTAGDKSKRNVHPHKLGKLHAMHNGTLHQFTSKNGAASDTRLFLDKWLAPRMRRGNMPARSEIERVLGRDNRLVLMSNAGQFTIYNRDHGIMLNELWLSNTYAWDYPAGHPAAEPEDHGDSYMRTLVEEAVLSAIAGHVDYAGLDGLRPYAGDENDWNLFYDVIDGEMPVEDYVYYLTDAGLLDIMQHLREAA